MKLILDDGTRQINLVDAAEVATIATFRIDKAAVEHLRAYCKEMRLSQGELLRRFIAELPTDPKSKKRFVTVKIK